MVDVALFPRTSENVLERACDIPDRLLGALEGISNISSVHVDLVRNEVVRTPPEQRESLWRKIVWILLCADATGVYAKLEYVYPDFCQRLHAALTALDDPPRAVWVELGREVSALNVSADCVMSAHMELLGHLCDAYYYSGENAQNAATLFIKSAFRLVPWERQQKELLDALVS